MKKLLVLALVAGVMMYMKLGMEQPSAGSASVASVQANDAKVDQLMQGEIPADMSEEEKGFGQGYINVKNKAEGISNVLADAEAGRRSQLEGL